MPSAPIMPPAPRPLQRPRPAGAPAPAPRQDDDPAVVIRRKQDFYRDGYRRMQAIALTACIVAAVGLVFGLCGIFLKPAPLYFPTGPGCTLRAMTPVSEAAVSEDDVIGFATKAAVRTYSYDHVNWRQEFVDTAHLFTKTGWDGILSEMKKTGNLDRVIDRHLIATAVAQSAPAIVDQYVQNGSYTWVVAFDMLTLYRGVDGDYPQKVRAEIHVVRVLEDQVAEGPPIRVNSLKVANIA